MSAAFQDHFSGLARRYADFRPRYPGALFDYLATLATRDQLVWDCACGSGQATIDLAARFEKIIATDGSAQQIVSAPRCDHVEYRVALADQSGLEDESIGLVTIAQALHWFNGGDFFAEVERVLKPGGTLTAWVYGTSQIEGDGMDAIVQDYYANVVRPYWPPEWKIIEGRYRAIRLPFPEIKTPSFRMEELWRLDQLLGYFSSWSATNRFVEATGRDPIEPLRHNLAMVWGEPERARRVVWPLTLRVAVKPW
jgi:SAM-dependent methyltransferase